MSPEQIAKLPHFNNQANVRGKSHGDNKMFRKDDGSVWVYQYNMIENKWVEMGEAVMGEDGQQQSNQQDTHNITKGQAYFEGSNAFPVGMYDIVIPVA